MKKLPAAVLTAGTVLVSSAFGASAGHATYENSLDARTHPVAGLSVPAVAAADISTFHTAISDLYGGETGLILGTGDVGGPVIPFV